MSLKMPNLSIYLPKSIELETLCSTEEMFYLYYILLY